MPDLRRIKLEHIAFALAFGLALFLRIFRLGAIPLNDLEADWALQALQIARGSLAGGSIAFGPQPAYISLTGILFFLLEGSNGLARFWPALAGSLLVLAPWLFSRQRSDQPALLDPRAAAVMAFGLAIDPGLVSLSRQAGSPIMALSFLALAGGCWYLGRSWLAGGLAALAVLSGTAALSGAVGLTLAWLVFRYALRQPAIGKIEPGQGQPDWRAALLSAAITVLAVGTLFLLHPGGLGSLMASLPAYLGSWTQPSGVPATRLLAALLVYQPVAVIFGVVAASRLFTHQHILHDEHQPLNQLLLVWALSALLLGLLAPGRQASDLVWVIFPLWGLASMELQRHLPEGELNPISLAQMGFLVVLLGLSWFNLASLSRAAIPGAAELMARYGLMLGILALGALTTILIGLGWSWPVARHGLVWGVVLAGSLYLLSSMWGASQLRLNQTQELWNHTPATGQIGLMLDTLQDLSRWNESGFPEQIDLVLTTPAASLRWALRDYQNLRLLDQPPIGELPSIIITTHSQQAPELTASYRGQDFDWWLRAGWTGALPLDLNRWLAFREAPTLPDQVILWARADLFPGGSLESQELIRP
jgi:hypothetical protein